MSGAEPLPALPAETVIRGQRAVYDRLPAGEYVCYLYAGTDCPAAIFGPCPSREALHDEIIRRLVYGGAARTRRPIAGRVAVRA